MKVISSQETTFLEDVGRIINRKDRVPKDVEDVVAKILADVEQRGDEALFEYTEKFDGLLLTPDNIEVTEEEVMAAFDVVDSGDVEIMKLSAERIGAFHERQRVHSWSYTDADGIELGQAIRPLGRVGIYAPGGRATYPSTVLMAAVPARIAGVGEIVLVSPARDGVLSPLILVAARLAGVDRIFRIGGAQAIAALACGTETVPRVDKIVGPGNIYVATAKKMIYGRTGIDMIAGPSEIVIVADGTVGPEVVAADLLSQAEHDPMAGSILLTHSRDYAMAVVAEVQRQVVELGSKVASQSLDNYGAAIITADILEAVDIANRLAPEHLELAVENPESLLERVTNAGAVFLGPNTPEALGDYMAGPNHILPTGGTARFSSPLGVYDFIKRMSVISFPREAFDLYGPKTARFADLEGLEAHKRSVTKRLGNVTIKKP